MSKGFSSWLAQLWQWFEKAGPLANLIQITSAVIAIAGAVGSGVYFLFRRRLKHQGAIIALLREDIARREEAVEKAVVRADRLERRVNELEKRLAETALAAAQREWRDGNNALADRALHSWIEREGEEISRLLLHRAEWAAARAAGELRSAGLAVAESFATAAVALWPANTDAAALASDLVALRAAEAQAKPPFPQSLVALQDADAVGPHVVEEEIEQALAAEAEANRLLDRGFYHLAMPLIDCAVTLLRRQLGSNALQTLRVRRQRARLLERRGHYEDALSEIDSVVKAAMTLPSLGLEHPETLRSRYVLALVLHGVGRVAEALPVIERAAEAFAANPSFGPEHPDTLRCRFVLALVFRDLGRAAAALPVIERVAEAFAANPSFGPEHPDTLRSRYVLAMVLRELGRAAEALPVIERVAEAFAADPSFGPEASDTLRSRYVLAMVLRELGRAAEAPPAAY